MLRCLSLTTLFALALTLAGCGSSSSEIPVKKDAAGTTISSDEAMKKAMQSMPPDAQKKMMGQMQKMKK